MILGTRRPRDRVSLSFGKITKQLRERVNRQGGYEKVVGDTTQVRMHVNLVYFCILTLNYYCRHVWRIVRCIRKYGALPYTDVDY